MATSYEVRDRLIARWQDLDTQVTDKQIRGIVDYFVGGVRGADDGAIYVHAAVQRKCS